MLVKPSHYDDDGYVIQWVRSAIPSNTLAVLNGLALDCRDRRVLGDEVDIEIKLFDESNMRIRPERIVRRIGTEPGLIVLVGVQSNHFPRAMDLARRFRAAGIQVCIGGFHVSGCVAMLPELTPELKEALDLGISLFAGEAEGRFEVVLHDAWKGALKPVYNYLNDLPELRGAALPLLPASRIRRTSGRMTSFDAGRGCPFHCSFCTIINVHGRKSRLRTADEVERIVRRNLEQGINRFFITDDNFARNKGWVSILDRLIEMREQEKLNIKFIVQVDTLCHRIPGFIEKSARAGVARVFIGLETIRQENLLSVDKPQNKIAEYRRMLLSWKKAGVTVFAGYIIGFPGDTPESLLHDVRIIQRELPIDLVEFHCLTPLPGSKDHQKIYCSQNFLEPDLNKFDLEHVTMEHPVMSREQWEKLYRDAWMQYYSFDHMKTIMRRSVATDCNPGNMVMLLAWYYLCFKLENIDPLQGGYLRRKYRRDRRPTLPLESPLVFYPGYIYSFLYKHVKLIGMVWRMSRFRKKLKQDPNARNYIDSALVPEGNLPALELHGNRPSESS
jgi:radical SAM superfamily enzyme YgiQ (UPF0313 family)